MFDWLFDGLTPVGKMYTVVSIFGMVFLIGILIHDHWWIKRK